MATMREMPASATAGSKASFVAIFIGSTRPDGLQRG
jgi:hypothetical protein